MKITSVTPFILHLPFSAQSVADSMHSISRWGVVGARTDADGGADAGGLTGWGFTVTHAHTPSGPLITDCIANCYAPLLIGQPVQDRHRLSQVLARDPALQWVGRAGITQLALAAVDVALWDLAAKDADLPLWSYLGGVTSDRIEAYNSAIGWLSIPLDKLVAGATQAVQDEGFRFLKLKVGHPDVMEDIARISAVRNAVGGRVRLAVDGNGKGDLPTCLRFAERARDLDLVWFTEPLWYDDTPAHRKLAAASTLPIALGEQLSTKEAFACFIDAGAVHFVQPDVPRLGCITEYIEVPHLAHAHRLPVVPHAGEMSQVLSHLAFWHPATQILEYIPWIRDQFLDPIRVEGGNFLRPHLPGGGTTPRAESLERFSIALRS